MPRNHPEDYTRFQQLWEATRDDDGIEHPDDARKHLAEELAADIDRILDFAEARAKEVSDRWDKAHQPETDSGQMVLTLESVLVLGDNERVRVTDARAHHTRQWLEVLAQNHAAVAAAWAAKDQRGRQLLREQEATGCTMWEADEKLNGRQ